MKKIIFVMTIFLFSTMVWAEEKNDDGKPEFSVSADFVSSYVWRGMYLSGTSIQPDMNFTVGGFSIGAWGSIDIAGFGWYKEVDLYASYSFGNFTAGLLNYWVSSEGEYDYFDFSEDTAHQLEANLSYSFDPFPLTLGWNTIIAGADHYDENGTSKRAFSTYVEATYSFSVKDVNLDVALGVSPWKSSTLYTSDYWRKGEKDGFSLVNLSLTASRNIKITDKYSLGIFGQLAFNPACEDAFFVFGIKF